MVELFIGMTTWDDAFFLPTSLQSIKNCFDGIVEYTVCVIDNESKDKSREIAADFGCNVIVKASSQADALNILLDRSNGKFTLFLHSDVALLTRELWRLLNVSIDARNVLVSPEDIGMGEFWRRSYGAGMPESSFMFWKTEQALKLRSFSLYRKWNLGSLLRHPLYYIPKQRFDFYGPHITHRIPAILELKGLSWTQMGVHSTPKARQQWYENKDADAKWSNDWAQYEYGFGNFYSLKGCFSHYHNWLTRELSPNNPARRLNGNGVPIAFIRGYTERFINDFQKNTIRFPEGHLQ